MLNPFDHSRLGQGRGFGHVLPMRPTWRFAMALGWMGLLICVGSSTAPAAAKSFQDEASPFFGLTNLHSIHLTLTPDQWAAMEPVRADFRDGVGPGSREQDSRAFKVGAAAMMGLDFPFAKATVEINGTQLRDVGVRYKGNGTYMMSQGVDKRPLKLDFNRFLKGQRFAGLRELNLHNNVFDPTFQREVLGYLVSRELGVPAPRTAYAEVTITIPGRAGRTYLGLYTVTEQVNDDFLENWYGTRKGLLMKPGSRQSLEFRGDEWAPYNAALGVVENGSATERGRMVAFLKSLATSSEDEFARRVTEWLDVDAIARFFALNVATANLDSVLTLGQNYYLYIPPGEGRLQAWMWDLDLCWGFFPMMGTKEDRADLSIAQPWQGDHPFVERLLGVREIAQRYRQELRHLIEGPMEPTRLRQRIESQAAWLRPIVAKEGPDTLARFEASVFGAAPNTPAQPGPGGFGRFENQSFALVEFIDRRVQSIRDQLEGRSEGTRINPGGFGGPGGGRPGGPDGPGGPPNPAQFVAMPFLRDGDANRDGVMDAAELRGLAERWFDVWDTQRAGTVTLQQVIDGLDRSFGPPPGGAGPGAPNPRLREARGAAPGEGPFRGPGLIFGPVFLKEGDSDRDEHLSRAEVNTLVERWSAAWDSDGNGRLTPDEIGESFGRLISIPGPGGPGLQPPGGVTGPERRASRSRD